MNATWKNQCLDGWCKPNVWFVATLLNPTYPAGKMQHQKTVQIYSGMDLRMFIQKVDYVKVAIAKKIV